jgi:glycosyltransferase involved in cell wall biosynthesis
MAASHRPLEGLRILYLCDRLGDRGGSSRHLLQVMEAAAAGGAHVRVASGDGDRRPALPPGVGSTRVRGLAAATRSSAGLAGLDRLLGECDVVHLQNIMNPAVLEAVVAGGRAVATVQDHRVLCPGPGKTLPDGSRCLEPMSDRACRVCLSDRAYRERLLKLTRERRDAVEGARLVALSAYMGEELAAVGLPGTTVIPPWFEPGPPRTIPGDSFLIAGRLVRHKGALEAWEAWRRAGAPLPLRVAGSGPLAPSMTGAVLLGWLGPRQMRAELRRARAVVFASRWQEPFGIVGVEALAQGTPVILVPTGGTTEWGERGCLQVERSELGHAIRALAADPGRAVDLGRAGQAAVAELFPRGELEARLWGIYADVAAQLPRGVGSI